MYMYIMHLLRMVCSYSEPHHALIVYAGMCTCVAHLVLTAYLLGTSFTECYSVCRGQLSLFTEMVCWTIGLIITAQHVIVSHI